MLRTNDDDIEQIMIYILRFHIRAIILTGTVPTPVELLPRRTTGGKDHDYLHEHLQYDDPYDSKLYAAAQQMFQEEIAFVKQWKGVEI